MSIGPVEYIAIAFPGNKFSGEIIPAIRELQDSGTIRVLDLVLITKDDDGNVASIELNEASPETQATFAALGIENRNLLGQEDFEDIGSRARPEQHGGPDDLGERLGGAIRDVPPQRRRHPRRQRPDPGRPGRGDHGRVGLLTPRHPITKGAPQMMRRRGGLVRAAATTAVVAGTAGAVSHHQQQKYAQQAEAQAYEQQQAAPPPQAYAPAPAPAPAAPAAEVDPQTAQLQKLADLHSSGHPHGRGVRSRQGKGPRDLIPA